MSETVGYKGKLEAVDVIGLESLEETCERVYKELDKEMTDDTYVDSIVQDDDDYVIVDEVLYKYLEKSKFDYEYVAQATENDDGTIDFLCIFYNGGTSLNEMIEDAISEL